MPQEAHRLLKNVDQVDLRALDLKMNVPQAGKRPSWASSHPAAARRIDPPETAEAPFHHLRRSPARILLF